MSKTTMQDIANELGVSRVSVWKVFNNQPGVSNTLKEQVITKARELGYFKSYVQPIENTQDEKTVSVIVSRPDSSTFWTNIIHRVAQELVQYNINLMYAYVPASYSKSFTLPNSLSNGTVSGAIILNVYDSQILSAINQLPIPKVFLDITTDFQKTGLNGDLFLLEGKESIGKITEYVIAEGKKDIGFIGDIQYAQTNKDRYTGFLETMVKHGLDVNPKHCLTKPLDIYSYYEEMTHFFDALDVLPDAFVCASDYVANFLYQYFLDKPEKLSHDILVTGFDGSNEYPNVSNAITTADVNTYLLGKRLAHQIRFREENPTAPFEVTYIYPKIKFHNDPFHLRSRS